jgi:hypothetical protein
MIVLENFKIIKDGLDFSVYELVERDEYKKESSDSMPKKTGNKVKEWKHRAYRNSVKSAFSKVADLAVEQGFNNSENVNELIENINDIRSRLDNFCK